MFRLGGPRDVTDKLHVLATIKGVLQLEADALRGVVDAVDDAFYEAVVKILECRGKVVVTGMGKSGLIARKIAATMSSTGTLAVFLHPAEAMHGDLGVVSAGDVVIAIGKSGESEELTGILPVVKRIGATVIAITGEPASTLGQRADVVLLARVEKEACPYDLAPTASTTVALAIGDALAIALMELKQFRPDDFALYHPGGKLGRQLLLKVADLMIPAGQCPVLDPGQITMKDIIVALSGYGLGIVVLSRDGEHLAGILTDGDIRRVLDKYGSEIFGINVSTVMNAKPYTIAADVMAVDALKFMEARSRPLNVLPVMREENFVGVIRIHELLRVA